MKVVPVIDVLKNQIPINSIITIGGWVRTRRDSKSGISFLSVYDGSCFYSIQIIINNTLPNYYNDVLHLTTGCSVIATGLLIESIGKGQRYEIQAHSITVIGWVSCPNTYPVSAKHHKVEYLREIAHLRPRTNLIGSITRIRHTLAQAIHRFMNEQGFFWVTTPLITTFDTEGSGAMFKVSTLDLENLPRTLDNKINYKEDFFGKEAFLTVSGQLNCESYACALSKVYTFGPTFRAENSNTKRHLAEFWMVEPEMAFATLDDIIELATSMLKYILQAVLVERKDDMQFFVNQIDKTLINRLQCFLSSDLACIDYTEAIDILQFCGYKFKNKLLWGLDLSSEHEHYLTEKYFKSPVIIKNYPKSIKAFYMRINSDDKTVAAMDILVPDVGEIIGGSQREERLENLDARIEEIGLNKNDYWWYRDLRRYGTVPHSGFGLGFERLIAYITGVKNIRDVIPFPRSSYNASF